MDLSLIAAATQSLGAIKTLAEGLVAGRDANLLMQTKGDLLAKVIDAQMALLSLSEENHTLRDAKRAAEEEVRRLTEEATERGSYELFEIASGAYAYSAKAAPGSQRTAPYFCQLCFDAGARSVLRHRPPSAGQGSAWICALESKHLIVGRDALPRENPIGSRLRRID